ncbi:hypothetical protein CICLE_v10003104mg, partial [Citrus x clementina]
GALVTSAVVYRTIPDTLIPDSVSDYFHSRFQNFLIHFRSQVPIIIEEFDGLNQNNIFDAANIYLGTKLNWVLVSSTVLESDSKKGLSRSELRFFLGKAIREESTTLKLHMIDCGGNDYWGSINFEHAATFSTMATDPGMKKVLIDDFDMFLSRKKYYKSVGKTWKCGYLLYGPPGTGKSSLIAAMANYLKFDVSDLDLENVRCNSDLRRLLIGASSRSILVIEDVALSALLKFVDGLWSSSGDGRILVMTTDYKDHIDPVPLRPSCMDMHFHLSSHTFRHHLFEKIEERLAKIQATPAEVPGELMKSVDSEVALQELISFFQNKANQLQQINVDI